MEATPDFPTSVVLVSGCIFVSPGAQLERKVYEKKETMYIAQFIPRPIACSIINDYSTFCLRDILYFRNLEEQDNDAIRGDNKENIVEFQENRRKYELLATTLISCWTKLSNDSILSSDWSIFADRRDGLAIVSTVECVCDFLLKQTEHIFDRKVWSLEHDEVSYYDGFSHPPEFDTMRAMFWKRKRYEAQREYRFAFLSDSIRATIDTLIFSTQNPKAYIKKIYFGPEMKELDKDKLLSGAIAADLVSVITNVDEGFKKL